MIPPSGYDEYLPVIERVFIFGVASYVHPTGFEANRIVTVATGIGEHQIDPFHMPGNPARMLNSGNFRLFTTDRRAEAFAEALGHTGDGDIPVGTHELKFYISGRTLNHSMIADPEYQTLCFMTGKEKEENHRFSQCVDYFLETRGFGSQFDTHGWLTVAGAPYGLSGYVHSWRSTNPDTIKYISSSRLA